MTPRIPHTVLGVLKDMQRQGFTGWVAGGAVRDSIMGRPVKDYDLFFRADGAPESFYSAVYSTLFPLAVTLDDSGERGSGGICVTQRILAGNLDMLLMGIEYRSIERHMVEFNFGFNQAAVDADGELVTLPQFERDIANKTATFLTTSKWYNENPDMCVSFTRAKWREHYAPKYPEFTPVWPA